MFKNNIAISIDMPEKKNNKYKHDNLVDKVAEYMTICESDMDSYYHWQYLKSLYNILSKKPILSPMYKGVLSILEPFIMKHNQYDVENAVELDAQYMHRGDSDKD